MNTLQLSFNPTGGFFILISCLMVLGFQKRAENVIDETSIDLAMHATVKITSIWGDSLVEQTQKGSGIIIHPNGFIVTNAHNIIPDANRIKVQLYDRRIFDAQVVEINARADLALLKIPNHVRYAFIHLSNTPLQVGQQVYAIGNPGNLDYSLTNGIVGGFNRNIGAIGHSHAIEQFIQTDVPINPGCSGGPLLNSNGELVGINTAIWSKTGRFEGYSFAIPGEIIGNFLNQTNIEITHSSNYYYK